jgi:hypothetical protein
MGYQVYWSNGRWQGYGVPAYCDHKGCGNEIDRGLGYQHPNDDDGMTPSVFVCAGHQDTPIDQIPVDYKREHPEWLSHILTDDSWMKWRSENKGIVEEYKLLLSDNNDYAK